MQLRLETKMSTFSPISALSKMQLLAFCLGGILMAITEQQVGSQTAPGYLWTVLSGGTDAPLAIALDAQGQIRTVGYISGDLYFRSYDTNGQILQSTTCANSVSFLAAALDSAGNVYATGQFTKNGQFGN